jgi:hypothetical protein
MCLSYLCFLSPLINIFRRAKRAFGNLGIAYKKDSPTSLKHSVSKEEQTKRSFSKNHKKESKLHHHINIAKQRSKSSEHKRKTIFLLFNVLLGDNSVSFASVFHTNKSKVHQNILITTKI